MHAYHAYTHMCASYAYTHHHSSLVDQPNNATPTTWTTYMLVAVGLARLVRKVAELFKGGLGEQTSNPETSRLVKKGLMMVVTDGC